MTEQELRDRVRKELAHLSPEQADELAMVVRRMIDALRPERIYLFGSQARGDLHRHSDIDLLLVVPHPDQPSYRLAQTAYRAAAPHSLDLEILVMPSEEFNRRSRAVASLPATVLREGRLLYAA